MNRNLAVPLTALLLVAVLALSGCGTKVVTTGQAAANTVTATGSGKASAAPDKVEFNFGVTVRDATGKGAMAKAARISAGIVKAIRAGGIDEKNIQTGNLSLYPQRDEKGTKVIGYEVNVSVRAESRDLEGAPKVIEAATAAGATDISGPAFSLSEDNAAHAKALAAAVADARKRAETMAKAAGKRVGAVVSITEGAPSVGPVPMYGSAALKSSDIAGAPQLQPGELDAYASVSVAFELE